MTAMAETVRRPLGVISKFAPCVTEIFATGCSYVDERMKKKTVSSIAASGTPNAIANGYAKVQLAARNLGVLHFYNVEDSRREISYPREEV